MPGEARAKPASIRDVARLASVSYQTVSRVLNDHPSIREDTRQRVLDAIRALDYRPNQAARALASARPSVLGILSTTVGEYGTTSAIVAIEQVARERGFSISTLNLAAASPEAIGEAVRQFEHEQVAGIIVLAPQVRVFNVIGGLGLRVPIATLHTGAGGAAETIASDQRAGARIAVEHLVSLGHRDILHLAGPQDWIEAESRMHGYLDAMFEADLSTLPPIRGDWTADFGHFAGRELAGRRDFTAIFAANDLMAIGLMHGFRDAGVRVPDDVCVIGFDDIPVAAHVWPTLSTVRMDFAELGTRAIMHLLAAIAGEPAPQFAPVSPQLIVRQSTNAAATRR
ncbi:LacI family DNA-binding transcriptional regulator [Leucobacter chromiiresistens]|uniref:DNA-binding transcriptional regulator, LacI/PurR family n=1 Tax=Leucobacter chromiiresistens TaxID=1079994 RepID=A0A1H0XRM8_9MICO|nr:LacI family DNA-binding transcriptional regulator [Leucobacter chromiiresistens]SDQ05469.1 DNA-binding transcriptional regulator, LacI/PurR family [Leucobacter chromiiresistens]